MLSLPGLRDNFAYKPTIDHLVCLREAGIIFLAKLQGCFTKGKSLLVKAFGLMLLFGGCCEISDSEYVSLYKKVRSPAPEPAC